MSADDAELVFVAERLDLVLVTADRELVVAFPAACGRLADTPRGRREWRKVALDVAGRGTTGAEDCGKMLTETIICEYFTA